jgi:hypothetical protein
MWTGFGQKAPPHIAPVTVIVSEDVAHACAYVAHACAYVANDEHVLSSALCRYCKC